MPKSFSKVFDVDLMNLMLIASRLIGIQEIEQYLNWFVNPF